MPIEVEEHKHNLTIVTTAGMVTDIIMMQVPIVLLVTISTSSRSNATEH